MASADYRLCDKCYAKTFYDSNLGYEYDHKLMYRPNLPGLGDWAVLCTNCALSFECVVVERKVPLVRLDECPEKVQYCNAFHTEEKKQGGSAP